MVRIDGPALALHVHDESIDGANKGLPVFLEVPRIGQDLNGPHCSALELLVVAEGHGGADIKTALDDFGDGAGDRHVDAVAHQHLAQLEAGVGDIEFRNGRFAIAGTDRGIGIMELAAQLRAGAVKLPPDAP